MSIARSITQSTTRSVTRAVTSRVGDAPTLDLGFGPQGGFPPGLIGFSRASTRTVRRAGDGRLVTLGSDVFATDHDGDGKALGLPIHGARTNIALYSERFDHAPYTPDRSSVSANVTSAPDGTVTADEIIENTVPGLPHGIAQTVAVVADTTYTLSLFVKANTRFRGRISMQAAGLGDLFYAEYDLAAGTISGVSAAGSATAGTSRIEAVGDGWYRVSCSGKINAASTSALLNSYLLDDAGALFYDGNGSSSLYFWGEMCEVGAFASPYIPTTASSASRAADSAIVTDLSWLNEEQGTFVLDGVLVDHAAVDFTKIIDLQNDAGTQAHAYEFSSGNVQVNVFDGTSHIVGTGAFTPGAPFSLASAYAVDDIVAVRDGGAPAFNTDTGGVLPSGFTRLVIGNNFVGSRTLFGTIRRIRYWPRRLPTGELISLTR